MAVEGLSSEQLPERLGKSRAAVYQYLAVANLAAEVQSMSTRVDIGLKHWLEIAKLPKPEDQVKLAQECAEKGYSVRELQARVKKLLNPKAAGTPETLPLEEAGPFQFTRKGKGFVIRSQEVPSLDMMDLYIQDLRVALSSFLGQERSASGVRYAA